MDDVSAQGYYYYYKQGPPPPPHPHQKKEKKKELEGKKNGVDIFASLVH